MYLQATINKFWMAVGGMAQRLTNRVHKIRCRERLGCDGVTCHWCRGAMVFHVSALEGPAGQAWRYMHRGQEVIGNAPKQWLRGQWKTTYELVQGMGSTDVELLHACTTHDRKQGYIQVLHFPHHLVAECLPNAPPVGLFFWRLAPHPALLAPQPPGTVNTPLALPGSLRSPRMSNASGAGSLPPRGPHAGSVLKQQSSQSNQHQPPAADSEYSYKSEASNAAVHNKPEQAQQREGVAMPSAFTDIPKPLPALSEGPRQCCLPGCDVREERYTGVRLLLCSGCKAACYCTAEHQRAHWRQHRRPCAAVALVTEASGPVVAEQ